MTHLDALRILRNINIAAFDPDSSLRAQVTCSREMAALAREAISEGNAVDAKAYATSAASLALRAAGVPVRRVPLGGGFFITNHPL